jgi:tetratricopeptide (TPR) repeat protein
MKTSFKRFAALLLIVLFLMTPVWATCGGGGGGGGGGMSGGGGGGGSDPVVYHVPWKIMKEGETVKDGLVVYWFPASKEEIQKSPLRESRPLSLYAAQCTSMQLADGHTPNADTLLGDSKLPVVVIAKPDGTVIKKIENNAGKFKVTDVEKIVGDEIKGREEVVDTNLRDGKAKAATDKAEATKLLQAVVAEKCMFPKKAKDAEKELKKLGVEGILTVPAAPNFDPKVSTAIVRTMKQGLVAENKTQYTVADKFYTQAHNMDPADPTPLRYLGELYRHHIGDWVKARKVFDQILDMPSDPLSRGVALHGLGKMTIHEGEFLKGLHLMEQAAEVYPLALTYRNLAVYWNSEGDLAKGNFYTDKALALDPTDPYNVVFAAVFMAANGKSDEAIKIANQHMDLLPASYNLAAIYAQAGQKEKALELLKRHFFKFERYESVRAKEMMEARVDMMFDSLRGDKDFMALTNGADNRLPMPAVRTMSGGMNSN